MTDEEMFAKLEAILLEDQEQQMNFPFQAMDYPIEDNNQYLMFGWGMELSPKFIPVVLGVILVSIAFSIYLYVKKSG